MALQMGVDVILQYNAGSVASPSWVDIGEQSSGKYTVNGNPVDTTTKAQAGWSRTHQTFNGWSIEVGGSLDNADAGTNYLAAAAHARTEVHVRWYMKTAPTKLYTGFGRLEGWDLDFSIDDAAKWSTTIRGNGEPIESATP